MYIWKQNEALKVVVEHFYKYCWMNEWMNEDDQSKQDPKGEPLESPTEKKKKLKLPGWGDI